RRAEVRRQRDKWSEDTEVRDAERADGPGREAIPRIAPGDASDAEQRDPGPERDDDQANRLGDTQELAREAAHSVVIGNEQTSAGDHGSREQGHDLWRLVAS